MFVWRSSPRAHRARYRFLGQRAPHVDHIEEYQAAATYERHGTALLLVSEPPKAWPASRVRKDRLKQPRPIHQPQGRLGSSGCFFKTHKITLSAIKHILDADMCK